MIPVTRGMIPTKKIYDPNGTKVVFKFKVPHVFVEGFMTKEDAREIADKIRRMGFSSEIIPSNGAKGYPWNVWMSKDKKKQTKNTK
jgi:hypothetical protein